MILSLAIFHGFFHFNFAKLLLTIYVHSFLHSIKFHMDDRNNCVNKFVCDQERISMSEDGGPCMNCYLMEIGEVDPQNGRCGRCGKRAANAVLGFS